MIGSENKVPLPPNNQNIKHTEERKNIKSCQGKGQVTYRGRPIRITPDFSTEILEARGPGQMFCRL